MNIIIDNKPIEVLPGETIIETARRMGCAIPSLCYARGAKHKSSCMVCAVKNCSTGQIIPSCTTSPSEGMEIDTVSEEVRTVRALSLELLLSDHRADCEAPCSLVCPQGLDIEQALGWYDAGRHAEAFALVAVSFRLPDVACDTCKAPCEKACRRGTVDQPVSIRKLIREIVSSAPVPAAEAAGQGMPVLNKGGFISRLGRFSAKEKERLKATAATPSRCLHCACAGRSGCRLRLHASEAGIKRPRYEASSRLPVMQKVHVSGGLWFEQAKCIRCGLCVYNSDNGFTFRDRGFDMQVVLPDENRHNISENLADLCPTGALYIRPINDTEI